MNALREQTERDVSDSILSAIGVRNGVAAAKALGFSPAEITLVLDHVRSSWTDNAILRARASEGRRLCLLLVGDPLVSLVIDNQTADEAFNLSRSDGPNDSLRFVVELCGGMQSLYTVSDAKERTRPLFVGMHSGMSADERVTWTSAFDDARANGADALHAAMSAWHTVHEAKKAVRS
jgi:hypothetical protein